MRARVRPGRLVAGAGLAICAAVALAASPGPESGAYLMEGGSGSLVIEPGAAPGRHFRIDSSGANGHSCTLGGTVQGDTGTTATPFPGEAACRVRFDVRAGEVDVLALSFESCRAYCGARAGFDGAYLVPEPGCSDAARRHARDDFLGRYRAGHFEQAAETLAPLLARCAKTLGQEEDANIRNDLAVSLLHLDRRADCRAVLVPLQAGIADDRLALLHDVAPADFEAWSTIARTTRHNLALCTESAP